MKSEEDPLWQSTYNEVFTAPSLQIPWYAILGNHDYFGDPEAQIRYSRNKRDQRWTMPDHNYTYVYDLPPQHGKDEKKSGENKVDQLQIVYIDTALISIEDSPVTNLGGRLHVTPEATAAYLRQVENMLAASSARWLLVAGHYPVYSYADHGHNARLIEQLAPLLRKYHVQAYFNGHDHVLQHIRFQQQQHQ